MAICIYKLPQTIKISELFGKDVASVINSKIGETLIEDMSLYKQLVTKIGEESAYKVAVQSLIDNNLKEIYPVSIVDYKKTDKNDIHTRQAFFMNDEIYGVITKGSLVSRINDAVTNDIVRMQEGRLITKKNIQTLIDQIQSRFPVVNFIQETNSSIAGIFPGKNSISLRTWVDEKGIHYNIDNIRSTDFVHELAHLLVPAIKNSNPELYKQIMDEVEEMIKNDHPLVKLTIDRLNINRLPDNDFIVKEELIATIAGMSSLKSIEEFLLNNNSVIGTDRNEIKGLWTRLGQYASQMNTWFKNTFLLANKGNLDYDSTRLYQLFKNMAQSIFNKDSTIVDDEAISLMNDYYAAGNLYDNIENQFEKNPMDNMIFSEEEYESTIEKIRQTNETSNSLLRVVEISPDENGKRYQVQSVEDIVRFRTDNSTTQYIGTVKDLLTNLNRSAGSNKILSKMDGDELVNYFFQLMTKRLVINKNKYKISYNGEDYEYDGTISEEALRVHIREDIVEPTLKFEKELYPKLKSFFSQYQGLTNKKGEELDKLIKEVFGEKRFTHRIVQSLISLCGIRYGYQDILRYSDMKVNNSPVIRSLYNPLFEGMDPLVIIHGIDKEGCVDLSILDITTRVINKNFLDIPSDEKTIVGAYGDESYYKTGGGSLSNADGDIRRLMLAMQIMSMANNGKIKIRDSGVYQVKKSMIKSWDVFDIMAMLHEVNLIRKLPNISQHFHPDIKGVLDNEDLYTTHYNQSYEVILRQWMEYTLFNKPDGESNIFYKFLERDLNVLAGNTADKQSRLDVISARMKFLERRGETDKYEYKLLGLVYYEISNGRTTNINRIEDMRDVAPFLVTTYDLNEDKLQWAVKEIQTTNSIVIHQFVERFDEIDKQLRNARDRSNHLSGMLTSITNFLADDGSKSFRRFFKTVEVVADKDYSKYKVKKGDTIKVAVPKLILNKNEDITGTLNDDDLLFANHLADMIEKQLIQNEQHMFRMDNFGQEEELIMTDDQALKSLKAKGYERGSMFVIERTFSELLRTGELKNALKVATERISEFEYFMTSKRGQEFTGELSNSFQRQVNPEYRLSLSGLYESVDSRSGYALRDLDDNMLMSYNIQDIFNFFMLSSIRKEEYEYRIMPVVKSTNAIYDYYKLYESVDMKKNREYLNDYVSHIVSRQYTSKSITAPIPSIKIKNFQTPSSVDLQALVRGAIRGTSFFMLAFKASVAIKSLAFNELSFVINGISSSFSGASLSNVALPGMTDLLWAHGIALKGVLGFNKDFKKMVQLAKFYQMFDKSEKDILMSPISNVTRRNIWNETIHNIGNWATDSWARVISMAAIMRKDGSWDAFSYDEKTGKISYDVKKDGRFYNTDGTLKTSKGENVVMEFIRKKLIEQKLQTKDEKELKYGYDFTQANKTFKWYADKHIIGAIDTTVRSRLGASGWFGGLMSQYRVFSFSKLNNFFHKTAYSESGAGYKAIQDEDGNWIAVEELTEIEGIWQSQVNAMNYITKLNSMGHESFMAWYTNQSPMRKQNLISAIVKLALMITIMGLVFFPDTDDEDEKGKKGKGKKLRDRMLAWNWLTSDLSVILMTKQFLTDPFPAMGFINKGIDVTMGREQFSTFTKRFGMVKNVYDIYDMRGTDDKEKLE